jgi:two-component system nitrate/nitrite response regulator NarL
MKTGKRRHFATQFRPWPPDASAAIPREQADALYRVLVASDVRLFQAGIALLLEPADCVEIVGTTTLPHVLTKTAQLRPDIVLLDATRPSNLECAKPLTDQMPAAKVVAFGVAETGTEILALAAAGIAGYVRNDVAPEDVVTVLASAMRDELLCSPRAAATLYHQVAALSRHGQVSSDAALSKRELQIADLIDRGLSNKAIARTLGIQATTVKNHVHNILDKLNVHRRGEAAACIRSVLRRQAPARANPRETPKAR